jgi:hypothetical protein
MPDGRHLMPQLLDQDPGTLEAENPKTRLSFCVLPWWFELISFFALFLFFTFIGLTEILN